VSDHLTKSNSMIMDEHLNDVTILLPALFDQISLDSEIQVRLSTTTSFLQIFNADSIKVIRVFKIYNKHISCERARFHLVVYNRNDWITNNKHFWFVDKTVWFV
jgi:hypothetical protein